MKGRTVKGSEVTASGADCPLGGIGDALHIRAEHLSRCSEMQSKVLLAFRFGWDEALLAPLRQV